MNLKDSVRKTTRKANLVEAVILTYGGGYASVSIGTSGRIIHGIKVVGGVPFPGEKVDIDYSTDVPVVRSRSGGGGHVIIVQGGGGGGGGSGGGGTVITSETPAPQGDWFDMAGWTIDVDGSIASLTGATVIKTNGEIVLGTSTDVAVMTSADALYRIYVGHSTPASAPFYVTKAGLLKSSSADIGGWNIDATTIYDDTSAIVLDSSDATITVGNGSPNIVIDGGDKIIKSSNWVAPGGGAGFGLMGASGDAEFNDVTVRGTIRASVFNIGEITATAGTSGVWKSASKICEKVDIPAVGIDVDIKAENSEAAPSAALFANGDVIRIKAWNGAAIVDVWGEIVSAPTVYTGYSVYDVRIRSGGSVEVGQGTAMLAYGQTDDGYITMSADNTIGESANISIAEVILNYVNTIAAAPIAAGTGYEVGDRLWVVSAGSDNSCLIEVLTLVSGPPGPVATVGMIVGWPGKDYTTGTKTTSGGTGTGCTVNVTDVNDPWDGTFLKVRIGNLRNSYGAPDVPRYGFAVGNYERKDYISYNAGVENGLVISAAGGAVSISGLGIRIDDTAATVGQIQWTYDTSDLTGRIYSDYAGSIATDAITWLTGERWSPAPWTNAGVILAAVDDVNSKDARIWLSTHGTGDPDILITGVGKVRLPDGCFVSGSGTLGASDGDYVYTANLRPYRNSSYYTVYGAAYYTAPKTHTSWDGDDKADASGTFDLQSANWGSMPLNIKAVLVRIICVSEDVSNPNDQWVGVGPNASYKTAIAARPQVDGKAVETTGWVPVSSSGDLSFSVVGPATGTFNVWIRIWGYMI